MSGGVVKGRGVAYVKYELTRTYVGAVAEVEVDRSTGVISVPRFFGVTSVLLLVVAAGLFSTGIGKLIGLGFIPAADPLWDTSWLLRDDSVVGGFLSGLTGYRARPTAPEVIGYVGYLVGAGLLFFTPRTPRAATPDREAARPSAGVLS